MWTDCSRTEGKSKQTRMEERKEDEGPLPEYSQGWQLWAPARESLWVSTVRKECRWDRRNAERAAGRSRGTTSLPPNAKLDLSLHCTSVCKIF